MRLIANYEPLAGVAEGDEEALWGTACKLTNIGTEDNPRLLYVASVEGDADAQALIDCGRFQAAEEPKAKRGRPAKEETDE